MPLLFLPVLLSREFRIASCSRCSQQKKKIVLVAKLGIVRPAATPRGVFRLKPPRSLYRRFGWGADIRPEGKPCHFHKVRVAEHGQLVSRRSCHSMLKLDMQNDATHFQWGAIHESG